jgi:hypothetical protein
VAAPLVRACVCVELLRPAGRVELRLPPPPNSAWPGGQFSATGWWPCVGCNSVDSSCSPGWGVSREADLVLARCLPRVDLGRTSSLSLPVQLFRAGCLVFGAAGGLGWRALCRFARG